jgi:DNA-binding transcriptional LysR family regulator
MNYTLNQLKIYLKVVQSKSITKAADELNLTQPAVSIQLKNFQAQFEIPLIEIIGKKVYVTDFGKEIAQSAEGIIEQVYAINFKTSAYKGQLFGRLKVSIVSTGKYVLPYFLNGFLRLNPGVELEMDVTNRDKVLDSLDQNEVDFSLVSLEIDRPNYEYLPLLQNDLYFIGNPETANMLPELGQVNSKSELPFIFREKAQAPGGLWKII